MPSASIETQGLSCSHPASTSPSSPASAAESTTQTNFDRSAAASTLQGEPCQSHEAQGTADDKAASPSPPSNDAFLVTFDSDDKRDPRNWSNIKKWFQLFLYLSAEVWVQVISSIFAPATEDAAHATGVSEPAMRTVQAIFLFGFALGPIVVAPVSEDYGRRPILLLSVLVVGLCQIPCALAGSIALMLPFRFVAGFFAATTFNAVGVVGDLWAPADQGWGVNSFALAAETGAYLGTIIGGYIVERIGWRWTFGVGGLGMAFITIVLLALLKETREGVLLSRRAAKHRSRTGDQRYYAAHEKAVANKTMRDILTVSIGRPVYMLLREPIVMATAWYDGVNYAVIFCIILAFHVIFGEAYGWPASSTNLPFLSVFVGALLAYVCLPLQQKWERRMIAKSHGELRPEERLGWLVTSPLFPISLFWLAWTALPSVHWISPVLAVGAFGFVSHIIFVAISDCECHRRRADPSKVGGQPSLTFESLLIALATDTVACYSKYAASAVGAQSLLRESNR